MSQYPPGMSPPGGQPPMNYMGYVPPPDPRGAARRAGILMIILGSLGLLCGACFAAVSFIPASQLAAQQAQSGQTLPPGVTPATLPLMLRILGCAVAFAAAVELVIGIIVRRGSGAAAICGIIFSSLLGIYFIFNAFVPLATGAPNAPLAACMSIVCVGVLVLQIVWLVQARKGAAAFSQARAAHEAQYWQSMQQQQAYQQPYPAPVPFPQPPGYGAAMYNAPPAGTPSGPAPTGWQWPASPPSVGPLTPPPPPPQGDSPDAQGPKA